MPETAVVETAEAVAEVVAPVVTSGTLNWKKVAAGVAIGVGVFALAYGTKKLIDKRKAEKTVEVNPVIEEIQEVVEEIKEEAPAPKTKAKK